MSIIKTQLDKQFREYLKQADQYEEIVTVKNTLVEVITDFWPVFKLSILAYLALC